MFRHFLLQAFDTLLITCCVTHLYFVFNIELNAEVCDATKAKCFFKVWFKKNYLSESFLSKLHFIGPVKKKTNAIIAKRNGY